MKCNHCNAVDTKVIESREVSGSDAIRRRRSCVTCQHRFTTYERIEHPQIIVVKHDGTRELFKRDKLLAGLYRACEKTVVTGIEIERLVADIENELYLCGETEVSSSKIGEIVMSKLAKINEVAYVRFASVYRRFKDLASFERELEQIRNSRE